MQLTSAEQTHPSTSLTCEIQIDFRERSCLDRSEAIIDEITKRKFDDYNDLIADLAKSTTLFDHHYGDLDAPTQAAVDANVTTLKSIYDADTCVAAFDKMVTNLSSILSSYYTAVTNVDNAADIDAVNAVSYE